MRRQLLHSRTMAVPKSLVEWTYESILQLLTEHASEVGFDWKEKFPADDAGKGRLMKEAVAMANSDGGVIVFGVLDSERLTPRDRIRGISPSQEFARDLGDQLQRADPKVPYAVREANVVQVVAVLPYLAPHQWEGKFYCRSPRGIDTMSTKQVRDAVIGVAHLRRRLNLLTLELRSAWRIARGVELIQTYKTFLPVGHIDTSLMAQLHADLLSLLPEEASGQLIRVRSAAQAFNFRADVAASMVGPSIRGGDSEGFRFEIFKTLNSPAGDLRHAAE
jgi:hypothetical protein